MTSVHRSLPSLNYTRRGFSLRPYDSGRVRLRLPGGVTIPVVWSRTLPSDPGSVRVYQDSLGDWFVSFVVEADTEPLPDSDREPLGVDWGVTEVATTSDDDYDLPHPEYGKRAEKRLARYQRMMARRKPTKGQSPSKGYQKAK